MIEKLKVFSGEKHKRREAKEPQSEKSRDTVM
jgi:ribosomal protein L13